MSRPSPGCYAFDKVLHLPCRTHLPNLCIHCPALPFTASLVSSTTPLQWQWAARPSPGCCRCVRGSTPPTWRCWQGCWSGPVWLEARAACTTTQRAGMGTVELYTVLQYSHRFHRCLLSITLPCSLWVSCSACTTSLRAGTVPCGAVTLWYSTVTGCKFIHELACSACSHTKQNKITRIYTLTVLLHVLQVPAADGWALLAPAGHTDGRRCG